MSIEITVTDYNTDYSITTTPEKFADDVLSDSDLCSNADDAVQDTVREIADLLNEDSSIFIITSQIRDLADQCGLVIE